MNRNYITRILSKKISNYPWLISLQIKENIDLISYIILQAAHKILNIPTVEKKTRPIPRYATRIFNYFNNINILILIQNLV
jgi:hypothetical protein